MDTKNLQILADVAHHGSFAAVARRHDLDPSSVSRTVAVIEAEVGVRLFQRTTRQLSLTEAGVLYLRRIMPLLEELDRAKEDALSVSATPAGTLRLTTSVAFGQECIVPLLTRFRRAFPAVKLELLMTDDTIDLVGAGVDLAVRLAPSIDADLIGRKLMATRYRVCAAPDYLAAHGPITGPAQLADHACLRFALPEYRSRWLFRDQINRTDEVPVSGDFVLSNALALRRAARDGLGPALLANWLVDRDITTGRLVDLFPDFDVTATTFDTGAWLLYPSRAFLPVKVRVTIDFLRQELGGGPADDQDGVTESAV